MSQSVQQSGIKEAYVGCKVNSFRYVLKMYNLSAACNIFPSGRGGKFSHYSIISCFIFSDGSVIVNYVLIFDNSQPVTLSSESAGSNQDPFRFTIIEAVDSFGPTYITSYLSGSTQVVGGSLAKSY